MTELALREQMCEVGRRLWQRGLIGATEGNFSTRLAAGVLLTTPAGVSKGHLLPDELIVIDMKGKAIGEGTPSSEIKLHTRIYARRPDCQSVVHAHPPIATAFSVTGEEIPNNLLPEAAAVLGNVVNVPFAMPGTDEVPDFIERHLPNHKTFLLSHHGAVTLGRDLMDAYNRMETLERIAKVVMLARMIGDPRPMLDDEMERLKHFFNGDL